MDTININPKQKTKFTIKQIFKEHWAAFLISAVININLIRQVVLDEVNKIIKCGDPDMGYALYSCPDCGKILHVPFRCKSRFCNTCGTKYSADRALSITSKLINCPHRHLVFTIPEELRVYFRADRTLLNLLFSAASNTVMSWFNERSKFENFTPGIVCVLHTFGRDLKWNPHIHMILTEGAAGDFSQWKPFRHIPYEMLRHRWRAILLKSLSEHIKKPEFDALKSSLYSKYEDGFYVYAKSNKSFNKNAVQYIVRYTGRPVMAQSRIIDYDGCYVTFWYNRHEDGEKVIEKITVFDFFKRLIIHIPDKHFKMIRYYGIYAKKHKFFKVLTAKPFINPKYLSTLKRLSSDWASRIAFHFGQHPLKCPCGAQLEFIDLFFPRNSKYKNKFEIYHYT